MNTKTPKNPNRTKTNNELTNEKKRELLKQKQTGASYRSLAVAFKIDYSNRTNTWHSRIRSIRGMANEL